MMMGRKQLQKTGQKNNNKIDKLDRRCFVFALIAKTELTARDNMRLVSCKGYGVSSRKKPSPAQHDFPMMSDCSGKIFLKKRFLISGLVFFE